ncbi:hypothetical protein N9917_01520 [Deltaproteobacteria bacterium]|nr:hypothetical protein [Deltaproteobacteria bacterium]
MFTPEVEAALAALTTHLSEADPKAQEIIQKLRNGEVSEADALRALMEMLGKNPSIGEGLNEFAMQAFAPTREGVEQMAHDADLLIMQPPSGTGLPRLNPLYEAGLIERAQFDGDIPELRHGPLPTDIAPAVPVNTKARNPVAIGEMLTKASEEVRAELDENRTHALGDAMHLANGLVGPREGDISRIASSDEAITFMEDGTVESTVRPPGTLSPAEEVAVQEDQNFMAAVDSVVLKSEPEGYKTGQLPALRQTETPSGSALAALTPEQRRASAWKFLSTTQGRRTALTVIAEMVEAGLKSECIYVDEVATAPRPKRVDSVPVYAEWSVNISGKEDTQSNFSFIDVAAKALTRKLVLAFDGLEEAIEQPRLEVIPINTVDVRKVGWAARIIPGAV